MKAIVKLYVVVIGLVFSSTGFAIELTEANVRALMEETAHAARVLDADGIARHLSEDCQISFEIEMFGQAMSQSLSKAEYIASLKEGWALYKDYQLEIVQMDIQMMGDHAIVNGVSRESMSLQGQRLFTESHSEETVRVVNGELVVTKILGVAKMSMEVGT